eukprot:gnl/TRDRNA2_/TRDRNA2_27620_c0_seq1.p1 gnl/TRDRNA2_/TRDRNA2_27620_c0~~gnl/TRDRNA2_/TRDRNA2_27620_c0_seq1.p1  ORF type:complete len:303 (-),score=43.42 gnl/TRDRNA2_/TRDRNA2_27620_c0_seq1:75-983(-)
MAMAPGATRALSLRHPTVRELLRLVTEKDYRLSKKRCVVAGTSLIRDLGRGGRYRFHELLMGRPNDPACEGLQTSSGPHLVESRALRLLAQVPRNTDFDGLVASIDLPANLPAVGGADRLGDVRLLLVLEWVEDPGLLGTLLRTAVAFQWHAVFFLPRCADPWSARCMRASRGALFEIPHIKGTHEDLQQLCRRKRLRLCVSHGHGVDIGSPEYEPPHHGMALLLREEYAAPFGPPGDALKLRVPDPWRQRAGVTPDGDAGEGKVFDPRALDVAVAGGILMHHIKHFHYPHVSRSPFLASVA